MEQFTHTLIQFIDSSKYILLFLGTIAEGPIVMVSSGFLYKMGTFSLLPMYLSLVMGDFVADIGWYLLGRFGTRSIVFKYGNLFGLNKENLLKVEGLFHRYHQKILIISKLIMGFGVAVVVLLVAGMFKIPFKNYVILNLIGGFIWTAFLIAIGYFVGNIFLVLPPQMKIAFVFFVLILFILMLKYISNYLKTKTI